MQTLLTAPLRQARLHIEQAQRRPSDRASELVLARTALFQAWSLTHEDHLIITTSLPQLSEARACLHLGASDIDVPSQTFMLIPPEGGQIHLSFTQWKATILARLETFDDRIPLRERA